MSEAKTESMEMEPAKMLVRYYYKGSWDPACRQALIELSDVTEELGKDGISVEAVTSEPEGEEEEETVHERFQERERYDLKFELYSDPKHERVVECVETLDQEWPEGKTGPYKMLLPTLVVLRDGHVIPECTWSWHVMGLGDVHDFDLVATDHWDKPVGEVPRLWIRPRFSDLPAAIRERRPPKSCCIIPFYGLRCP